MTVLATLTAFHDWLKPLAAPLGGILAIMGGLAAAFWGKWSQRQKTTPTTVEQATYAPRPTTVRLAREDREAVADLGEKICTLARVVKAHGKVVEASTDKLARNRQPRR